MSILALKLFLAPLLIVAVTYIGRRWGSAVSGLLIGLPLVSAPISFIMAWEHGGEFGATAAVGSLLGQISNCLFGLTYIRCARGGGWPLCSVAAVAVFFATTFTLNAFSWSLLPAIGTLVVVIVGASFLIPRQEEAARLYTPPRWDLPARMLAATLLVVVVTGGADTLGPQLAGLISPFPAFSVIFAAFTHAQLGATSATILLRGVVVGSFGYATFFTLVGALLERLGLGWTYALAIVAAVSVSASIYRLGNSRPAT